MPVQLHPLQKLVDIPDVALEAKNVDVKKEYTLLYIY